MLFIIFNVGSTAEDADEIFLLIKITFGMLCFAKVAIRNNKTMKINLMTFKTFTSPQVRENRIIMLKVGCKKILNMSKNCIRRGIILAMFLDEFSKFLFKVGAVIKAHGYFPSLDKYFAIRRYIKNKSTHFEQAYYTVI